MASIRKGLTPLAFLLASVVAGPTAGGPPDADPLIRPLGAAPDAASFSFRVGATDPSLVATGAGYRVEIPGFETRERRVGAPDLPTRSLLVAIPPGVQPRLEIRSPARDLRRPGIRPRPVPSLTRPADDAPASLAFEESFAEEPSIYEGTTTHPRRLAWLGEIGVLRRQRYVTVHLAPVRYDPVISGLRIAGAFEVTVHFDGAADETGPAPADPLFESVYRSAFLNYGQGTGFRLGGDAPSLSATAGETDSGAPRIWIRVRSNGLVRLDYNRMSGTPFLTEPLSTWKVSDLGAEIPIQVRDADGDDVMDPGDWVQFYGQALDFDGETVLNHDFPESEDDIHEFRDFTDENRYLLTVEAGPRSRIGTKDAVPTHTRPLAAHFEALARREVDDAWRPLGPADPWYWAPTLSDLGQASRTDSVSLPGLLSAEPVRVRVHLQGRSGDASVFPDHDTRIRLLNASDQVLATDEDDGTFDDIMLYLHDFTWTYPGSGAQLTNPAKVRTEVLANAAARNDAILDWIEIRYRRSFQAAGDALTFDWPDGDAEFQVTGLQTADPVVYEITGKIAGTGVVQPVRLTGVEVTGAGPYAARFRIDNDPAITDGEPRRFVVAGANAAAVPANPDFETDVVSDLRDPAIQADMIVIAHRDLLDDPVNCSDATLTQLLDHRLAADGITSKVACLVDVQDEFNDGLPGPLAIRNFLAWVMSAEGWAEPKPSYVMLLGDGSYDHKAGTANGDWVPTQILFLRRPAIGYYASDNINTAVVGDDPVPDLVIGRLSARTPAELDRVIQKILDYEQIPPGGNWTRHVVTVADRGKRDASGNVNATEAMSFEDTNEDSIAYMKAPPHTARQFRYWTDYCDTEAPPPQPCQPNSLRGDIKDAVNGVLAADPGIDGASVVQYSGHGNFEVWSDDAFFDERDPAVLRDTNDLVNGGRLPWLLVHNCLSGGFHTTMDHSMAENWLLRDGGGAVATLSPSGPSFNYVGNTVINVIWKDVFGPPKERRIGAPLLNSLVNLCTIGSIEPCQNYVFLGDPAMLLNLPAVAPATDVQATPGNGEVELDWLPSADAASYDVYRKLGLTGFYSKANTAPVTGTCTGDPSRVCYVDDGVRNTNTYYYYVVALDAEGFESRWSNFNSDCDVSGPDCVSATPFNPDPPSPPTGLVAVDAETGGRLDLSWNANPEDDVNAYTVLYGTETGVYTDSVGAGKSTTHALQGLENGTRYYIAVTATNTSGHTSAPSAEVDEVPTFVRGEKAPAFITDLILGKSGSDAVLTWGAVTTDIYGKSETVDYYEIFRGNTPDFEPTDTERIGTVPGGVTTFTDAGALGAALPDYHYLVRAVDLDGNAGGLGRQLPHGIGDLTLGKSGTTPGDIVLSWSAVETVFDPGDGGGPTTIDRYEIYAADAPFTRAQVRDGAVPLLTSVTTTSVEITPAAGDRYYSVLAVDTRGNISPF